MYTIRSVFIIYMFLSVGWTKIVWSEPTQNILPLFKKFPSLQEKLPRYEILKEKTPYHTLHFSQQIWVKRDDQVSGAIGGNKARKLEFLIADALQRKAKTLVTVGMVGSNHALSVAALGKALGLKVKLILGPQPISENVRKKLLSFHALGAEIRYHSYRIFMLIDILWFYLLSFFNSEIYFIPPGGSNSLGSLGYVNAFFELVEQVGEVAIKEKTRTRRLGFPEQLIVPIGTGGTTEGLLVGSCLAGYFEKIKIIAVDIVDSFLMSEKRVRKEAAKIYDFIYSHLSEVDRKKVPQCNFKSKLAFEYVKGYAVPEYGRAQPEVEAMIKKIKQQEGIELDSTYSGKAMHYLMNEFEKNVRLGIKNKQTIFWLTYNAYDLAALIQQHHWTDISHKWKDLPKKLWMYFE